MKKYISVLLVLCMMLGAFAAIVPANAAPTHGYLLGDANDDVDVTMKDILLVRKYVSGSADDKDLNMLASDVDFDDDVTMKDILKIRKYVSGSINLDGVNTDGRYKIDTLSIGGRNISRFTVVIPRDCTPCMKNAAKTFRNYVSDACGYPLDVIYDDDECDTYKIEFMFDKDNENELGLEGYRVKVEENGDLSVICGSLRGPIYAAYFMLEELIGYRFLTGNVTYLYRNRNVDVSQYFDMKEIPGYTYRSGGGGSNAIALRANDGSAAESAENGWRVGTLFIHAHSYGYQMAGYDLIYTPESEMYANTQPCLTEEETYYKIVDYNLKLLDERERGGQHLGEMYTQISCSPNDNTDFCQCSACKKIYEIEGSIAGTVFRLANRVIEKLRETYPTLELYTIAYWDARNPPKFTRPDDAICVCFCIGGCNNHTYDDVTPCAECGGNPRLQSPSGANSSNVEDMDFCTKWAELTNNLQIWYYGPNYCYYMAPSPNIFNIFNDYKFLYNIGASGMYSEGSGGGYTFEKLRSYLQLRMSWNPSMSEDEFNDLINEYLMIYYGEGWTYIREYLEMQNEAGDLQGCWTNNYDRPWDMYNEEYFLNNYHHMAELFEKAYAATKGTTEKERIRLCRLHCDFLGLSATYERDWVNGNEESKALYKKRYQALYDYIVQNGVRVASFSCQNMPKSRQDIYNPMRWLFDDFNGHWIWNGTRWV